MKVSDSSDAGETGAPSPSLQTPPPPTKKKRNLPGVPDPNAEVIALSPRSLLATNRFVCEICNKGFQRDQNLQLHKRGHNLPWKLRRRTTAQEFKKRVYVCPASSCIHHDPSRALGDLTGIKKHFCRKHGEKKWKCDRCSKKYAVKSDWKAHSKTCGTRQYRCDCGTFFSRRDSFITHTAFCDALAKESAKVQAMMNSLRSDDDPMVPVPSSIAPVVVGQKLREVERTDIPPPLVASKSSTATTTATSIAGTNTSVLASLFSSAAPSLEPTFLCLSQTGPTYPSLFSAGNDPRDRWSSYRPLLPSAAHMSATALLQKATQMGASATNYLVRGFGTSTSIATTTMASPSPMNRHQHNDDNLINNYRITDPNGLSSESGLGLGVLYGNDGGGDDGGLKPATFDFLGLGMVEVDPNDDISNQCWT